MSADTTINKSTAIAFMELCAGGTSGMHADIPNSPQLHVFCRAHGLTNNCNVDAGKFADVLEACAKELKGDGEIPF